MQQITDLAIKAIKDSPELAADICKFRECKSDHLTRTLYLKPKREWLTLYGIVKLIMKHTGFTEKQILERKP